VPGELGAFDFIAIAPLRRGSMARRSTLFSLGNSSDAFLVLRAQNLGMAVAITGDVTANDNPPDESAGRGPLRTVGPAQSDRRRW
jgi:hypothetical protein